MYNALRSFSILPLTLILCWLPTTNAFAAEYSQYADSWISSGTDWTPSSGSNPLGPPDSNCVGTSNAGTVYAQFTFASFGIPGGETIVGIEVKVNYGSVVAPTLQLYLGGSSIPGASKVLDATDPAGSCNASQLKTAGGPMDDWGAGLTIANFNSGTVAVRLTRTTGPDNPVSIDIESVQMVVHTLDPNSPPVASCQNVTVSANASCQAAVTAAQVDNGSNDPDGDELTLSLVPPGPYNLGVNNVTLHVSDGMAPDATCAATITVEDNTAPVVSLTGANAVTLECNIDSYTELGATATDNCDNPVSVSIGGDTVDAGTPGVYVVTYDATDTAGNAATQRTRTVTVQDTIAPVITLNGDNPITLECSVDAYVEPGASVADACGISTPVVVGGDTVDVTVPGTYNVTYDATDDEGNTATQKERTVTVEDTLPPVISCNLPIPATIIPPDAPISFTATADDACEGIVPASIDNYDCYWTNPSGKLVDKTESCVVSFSGDTLTIDDSGGVGDNIEWSVTAADSVPNQDSETCEVEVVHPND